MSHGAILPKYVSWPRIVISHVANAPSEIFHVATLSTVLSPVTTTLCYLLLQPHAHQQGRIYYDADGVAAPGLTCWDPLQTDGCYFKKIKQHQQIISMSPK